MNPHRKQQRNLGGTLQRHGSSFILTTAESTEVLGRWGSASINRLQAEKRSAG
jgi:hypothetical protein